MTRQARTLAEAEFGVETFGLGAPPTDIAWTHTVVPPLKPYENAPPLPDRARPLAAGMRAGSRLIGSNGNATGRLLGKLADRHDRRLGLASRASHYFMLAAGLRLRPSRWASVFWDFDPYAARLRDAVLAAPQPFDLIIANDWECLPAAAEIAAATGARILYDAHEFAADEFSGQRRFRLWHRPLAVAVEGALIRTADMISSVSQGLCDALQTRYELPETPTCIRNLPHYAETPWRPHAPEAIYVLYQGVVARGRALDVLIDSVSLWPDAHRLIIRGPCHDDTFSAELDDRITASGSAARIRRDGPVAFRDLVPAAAASDIGVMLLPGDTIHNRFALPNKVFEYMMAGAALIVSDLPEMASVVEDTNAGICVSDLSAQAVAEAVTTLSGPTLEACRRAGLNAAKRYNWEQESARFIAAVRALLSGKDKDVAGTT